MRIATGVGMSEYIATPSSIVNLLGRSNNGKRTIKLNAVDSEIVPNNVVAACVNAAFTIVCEVGAGTASRWKYHCDTVADVADL